jgi:hypothetical protein
MDVSSCNDLTVSICNVLYQFVMLHDGTPINLPFKPFDRSFWDDHLWLSAGQGLKLIQPH